MHNNERPWAYNLDEMTEDEKDEAIIELARRASELTNLSVHLQNMIALGANHLSALNRFGKRRRAMATVSVMLAAVSSAALYALGVDLEQAQTDAEFEDIISKLGDNA